MKLTLPMDPTGTPCAPVDDPIVADPTTSPICNAFLLVCEARSTTLTDGFWRFALETADGEPVLDAEDKEVGDLNRLTLLAAVRGLESIEGPSSITLLSNNRYLIRSLSDSLPRWRQNDFIWEQFGRRVDVQNADLWRRVDRALGIHRVEACLVSSRLVSRGISSASDDDGTTMRIDRAESVVPAPKFASRQRKGRPNDQLRRLLMSGGSHAAALPRNRFTAEDLSIENAVEPSTARDAADRSKALVDQADEWIAKI